VISFPAVLSVAMPNMNHSVHDTPAERCSGLEYEQLLQRKWRAVLDVLRQYGTQVKRIVFTGRQEFVSAAMEAARAESTAVENSAADWKVVGGISSDGIRVREEASVFSTRLQRLSTGSLVKELAVQDNRLHYELIQGDGPPRGWVSLRLPEGKDLLVRLERRAKACGEASIAHLKNHESETSAKEEMRNPAQIDMTETEARGEIGGCASKGCADIEDELLSNSPSLSSWDIVHDAKDVLSHQDVSTRDTSKLD